MGITSIGTFLHRELHRNWGHPRLRSNTRASIEMHQCWVGPTRVHYFELLSSRLLHYMARCVVRRRCSFCKTTTIISTMTKRPTRPLPSHPTILCCNQQEPRSAFGTPNFCLIRTDRQDYLAPIAQTNHRFVLPASLKALAPCVMGVSPRYFYMM